jgi:tetratricopeptide (TPR) repeat protein
MYLLAPPELAALEDEWHRLFALNKPISINEYPIGGEHVWLPENEQQWSSWLQQHPQAFDSLDILDDLATAFYLHPQLGAPWLHDAIYLPVLQRAEAILEKSLASQEDPLLPWVFLQNRPPLRALARLALGVMMIERNDKKEEAMQRTQRLLALNPSDNHGFRCYVINQLLTQGKDSEALELSDRYDDDMTPEIVFGRILALYREGDTKQAVFELGEALDLLPKIPRYLTAKNIKQPRLDPDGIIFGGDDQAWIYREDMRQVWEETEGALAWLKKAAAAFR